MTLSERETVATERARNCQVVIIDDHELFSTSLMIALRDRGVEARKVAVERLEDFAGRPRGERPGVVVLDLNLGTAPDGRRIKGYDWIPRLRASGWPVLTVTGSGHDGDTAAAIAAGAVGVVSKSSPLGVLLKSVVQTVEGESLIDDDERRDWERKHRVRVERCKQVSKRLDELTAREREVLEAIAPGQHAADIAKKSVVSLTTVRTQIRSILRKLDVNSQIEAIALLRQYSDDV